jgi:hypothetical protein
MGFIAKTNYKLTTAIMSASTFISAHKSNVALASLGLTALAVVSKLSHIHLDFGGLEGSDLTPLISNPEGLSSLDQEIVNSNTARDMNELDGGIADQEPAYRVYNDELSVKIAERTAGRDNGPDMNNYYTHRLNLACEQLGHSLNESGDF